MESLGRWAVEQRNLAIGADPAPEALRWQDPATPLSIWRIDGPGGTCYRLRFSDDLTVDVLPGDRIRVAPKPGLPQRTIDHFLADQVYPRLLAQAGDLVVHAGAVHIGSSAVMLMGQSGRGKSTLTASFDKAGHTLLGDDAMVVSSLDSEPCVRAVYPSLRLRPDSIDALMPGAATAGPVAYYGDKERIDVWTQDRTGHAPVPVKIICAIMPPTLDDQIRLRRMTVAESCMALVESSFALDPSDVRQARSRLDHASALARAVPAFAISYPRDYARLGDVRQAILDQASALKPA